jgi:hypothetical protein
MVSRGEKKELVIPILHGDAGFVAVKRRGILVAAEISTPRRS